MKNYITVFKDINNNKYFILKSTIKTNKYIYINKIKYQLFNLEISSYSHPFYKKKKKFADTIGKIDKFKKKYKKFKNYNL
ncbi:MAG: 50S ribosomal protein L31 [Candidatus Shikimatogenerans sp. AspAUS03]|uniref:50S ribosomal protein L31 n=1 Tax=Candidatus Shikimatogenerans sp. AspAUS03 TaxID=3158563 RepID=A0AAU7QSE0_9FLAO